MVEALQVKLNDASVWDLQLVDDHVLIRKHRGLDSQR